MANEPAKVTPRTASEEIVLQTTDLVAGYIPGVNILNGCNVYVAKGELVGIIGPNGAGKSTLLKAICGVTQAHRGAVVFDGRDITHAPPEEIAPLGLAQVPGGQFTLLPAEPNVLSTSPMFLDTGGTADFIGTPKKENPNLRRLEKEFENRPDAESFHFTSEDNPYLSRDELESIKQNPNSHKLQKAAALKVAKRRSFLRQ